ncbi:intermediate cleaving peptidase 55 [Trichomonascus vanleenenianus]|uniref:aminopeptidase n=1 Tax=Trichomonascus vanleenenianus TaxID=2268995 RepID=UPI003ECABB82
MLGRIARLRGLVPVRGLTIKAGQPIHETRPHLVPKGDLTPGIEAIEYYARRRRILESIPDNSMVVVPGNETQFATGSVFYEFRQDPNFYYLTGFLEPNAALVLHRKNAGEMNSIMFVPESDKHSELWEGERTGTKGAVEIFNADAAFPINEIDQKMPDLLKDCTRVYTDISDKTSRYPRFFKSTGKDVLEGSLMDILLKSANQKKLMSANYLIEQSRLFKTENEIDCMRVASEISAAAFNKAYSQRFKKESDLHAFLDYEFRVGGCEMPAYLPVVAGGKHALVIHYTRNDDRLRDGELVLVDAGGRFGGYCADISRTWPVNGKFTGPQRDLYQAVLNVQKKCIELCTSRQGASLDDIHRASEELLYTELLNAGMTGLSRGSVRKIYPHYIGHHLGIDVHDLQTPSRFDPLAPNQVITIEPGVYVPEDSNFPRHFHNIGIRIEDNVVIGKESYEVLTCDALKEIDDIEAAANPQ